MEYSNHKPSIEVLLTVVLLALCRTKPLIALLCSQRGKGPVGLEDTSIHFWPFSLHSSSHSCQCHSWSHC